jgi:hypothetical protein
MISYDIKQGGAPTDHREETKLQYLCPRSSRALSFPHDELTAWMTVPYLPVAMKVLQGLITTFLWWLIRQNN